MVAYALIDMTICSVSHAEEGKNDLVKDVHRLARLGIRLEDSPKGDFLVHHTYDPFKVVVVIS